jgi:cellulose synthase/poly-beta-1,6-N-acetylglucosamine synthase-like glycosyltransferase
LFSTFLLIALLAYITSLIAFYFGLRRSASAASIAQPFVSVIVAARNEEQHLPDLLSDLSNQTYPHYEAIVVDDRSSDGTAEIVRHFAARSSRFKLLQQRTVPDGHSPKKSALNAGIEQSCGEILFLTDADCRVQETWIENTVRYFEPDVAMVLGSSELIVEEKSSLFECVQGFEFLTLVSLMAASANLRHPLGASGHNIALRRRAFAQVGGYNSVMHRIAGDDMLMLQLMRAKPEVGRIVYADDLRARNATYPEATWQKFRNQRARWASSGTHHFRGDALFMIYAIGSLVLNMAVLFGWMWAWAGWTSWFTWLALVSGKLVADFLFFGEVCRRFERQRLLIYLPLWFLVQPIYLLLMAVWGQRGRFTWKP